MKLLLKLSKKQLKRDSLKESLRDALNLSFFEDIEIIERTNQLIKAKIFNRRFKSSVIAYIELL